MIQSRCEVSGVLCCSREEKPPSHFQSQASLLTHKANYLLVAILKDTSVDMGEAQQHAAHLPHSSQPGLLLELFLRVSLTDPIGTHLLISSPSLPISGFAPGS